ncbi:hypothetical protein EVAR_47039_1 [Eumeta japonica]|uniref:Uncharacterized protein n=1 Tax=Eumeta variegata TaxID=151549 RepID=A0A4C1XHZ7_EUMVA|nr:hypothetical protein EVAR_47039_1 [Eumeta japonica]
MNNCKFTEVLSTLLVSSIRMISEGGRSGPPVLSLTVRNAPAETITSRLYSLRCYLADRADSFSCRSRLGHGVALPRIGPIRLIVRLVHTSCRYMHYPSSNERTTYEWGSARRKRRRSQLSNTNSTLRNRLRLDKQPGAGGAGGAVEGARRSVHINYLLSEVGRETVKRDLNVPRELEGEAFGGSSSSSVALQGFLVNFTATKGLAKSIIATNRLTCKASVIHRLHNILYVIENKVRTRLQYSPNLGRFTGHPETLLHRTARVCRATGRSSANVFTPAEAGSVLSQEEKKVSRVAAT